MRFISMILATLVLGVPAVASAQWDYTPPGAGHVVTCSSHDNQRARCRVPGWPGARLVQQTSLAACVWGRTWGFNQGSIWVDNGCRGQFTAAYGPANRPHPPAGNQIVNCGSSDYHQARCPVPYGWYGARLVRQTSKAACIWGRTWGFNYDSIWVGDGCRGQFAAAGSHGGGWQPGPGWNSNIRVACGSPDYKYRFCRVDIGPYGSVALQNQTSETRCVLGSNWGWNRAGVWVDKGCSGRFMVLRR